MRGVARAAALVLLVACERGPEPIHVESVRVAQGALAEPLREAGISEEGLANAARDALARAGFRVGDGGRRAYRARLDVLSARTVPTGAGTPRLELAVELELIPVRGAGDPVREAGRVSRTWAADGAAAAWRRALDGAADRAAEGLAVAFAAEGRTALALQADLSADDPRIRSHAARVLGARGDAVAVPALVALLDDDHPEVVERAVAALARIRDPRAVGPLIDVSRRRDAGTAARYARVIGEIGGDEAEGYLLTIESGHPDAHVRRAAREALATLEARAARAKVAAGR